MGDPLDSLREELAGLERRDLRRRPPSIAGAQGPELTVDGRPAINFSSNNYLGLANDSRVSESLAQAARSYGVGAGASRLIAGSMEPHLGLERALASWKGTESALLFNSGYQANIGLISSLAGPEDVIFSDALNHASLIDGSRLSRARVVVYRHRDCADLAAHLVAAKGFRRRFIVTDSIFSMDGDHAPLSDLAELAQTHQALLIVDEAHAVGVLGPAGRGLCAGLPVPIQMGTLSKALGVFGAYVAGPAPVTELLLNRARSFIFTTALPPAVAAAAETALSLVASPQGDALRTRLHANSVQLRDGLIALGILSTHAAPSHIVPLQVSSGEPAQAMEVSRALLQRGIFAQGIRPPTVPPHTARIRFALMATHSSAQIDQALAALADLRASFHVRPGPSPLDRHP